MTNMDTNWISIVSLIVSIVAIPTLTGLVWKDIYNKRKENSEAKKAERKREFQENVREVIRAENKPIKEKIDCIDEKLDKVSDGTLSTLRNDIKNCYYESLEKGYRNDYDFKNIHDLYDDYKNLGGNSFIEDIMVRFDKLPPKDVYKKELEKEQNNSPKKKNTCMKGSQGKEKTENK